MPDEIQTTTSRLPGWKPIAWLPDGTPYCWSPIDVDLSQPLFSDEAKFVAKKWQEWSRQMAARDGSW